MKYNLTESQRAAARYVVERIRSASVDETFSVILAAHGTYIVVSAANPSSSLPWDSRIHFDQLDALAHVGMVRIQPLDASRRISPGGRFGRLCTITNLIYEAVDKNFEDQPSQPIFSSFVQPHPPEIAISLDRLRLKYPDPTKLGFLIMRFTEAKPFDKIVEVIKQEASEHGITIIRADDNQFHADLWGNVRTHLHGCGFGIAVYERIETNHPNANVGLEVGYLLAMNKPVLLLKDKTVEVLQADLAGKLYKSFDPHDAEGTIPSHLKRWLEDNGIIVPVS